MAFKKLYNYTSRNGTKNEVYCDEKTGQFHFEYKANIGKAIKANKNEKKEQRKMSRLFDADARSIAYIPLPVINAHPEVFGPEATDEDFFKWLDAHPWFKNLPASYTRSRKDEGQSPEYKDNFDRIFNG